jgi:hypothetical protein
MANDKSKPSIPAWQQRSQQQPTPDKTDDSVKDEDIGTPATEDAPNATESGLPAPAEPVAVLAAEEASSIDATAASQLENMKTFLEDPAVKQASPEKKRAFFLSKGISADLIEQALKPESSAFSANDFESFKQTEAKAVQTLPQSQPPAQIALLQASAPPIITYPEFLVEAHKPPPLITPARMINTAYIAGTLYAVLYGASKYLVQPMSLSLSAARHDFAQHSQSKLDEMNERLAKLVSKIPSAPPTSSEAAIEEDDSETSDPTELYHRDIGVQTSPLPSRRPSSSFSSLPGFESQGTSSKKDALTHSLTALQIMQSHLSEMLARAENLEQPNKDRQESVNKLRTYLDNLMFAYPSAYGMWSPTGAGGFAGEEGSKEEKEKEDVIEEVKKEIRGVKGVLLSAKRFPGVAGRAGG